MKPVAAAVRRRLLAVLFSSSALTRIGFVATITVSPLVAEDLLGSAALAGLPSAAATVGVASGTVPIAALMVRRGRRAGIGGGLGLGLIGVLVAATAIAAESLPLFVVGMFAFGFGMAGDRLSRYAASDIAPAEHRSFSIALIVWAGTIGAVVGPVLLEPVEKAAEYLGLESLAGAPLLAAVMFGLAVTLVFAGLRPDPLSFVDSADQPRRASLRQLGPLLKTPAVRYSVAALMAGQIVMVMIMTMTPVHIRRAGEGLGIVGLVIGAHQFGMFALSPVTGLLADRLGRLQVMILGQGILVISALMAATAGGDDRGMLVASLFLLGFGWNLGFVAGSAYLTEGAPISSRVSLQGLADTAVWSSGAAASASSGFLLEATGYGPLALLAPVAVLAPLALLVRYRTRLA